MPQARDSFDTEKRLAAEAAVSRVRDGMTVGLGTGSTAAYAIALLGKRVANGLAIRGIPTSQSAARLAVDAGIELTDFEALPRIDVTIDGADRFDDDLNLIKGGGGALLREKIVAAASNQVIIVADSGKRANPLGGFPVPVEVVPFGLRPTAATLSQMGLHPELRRIAGEQPFVTDEGNWILDLAIPLVPNPVLLAAELDALPGVVCHGLFLNLAHEVLMGRGETVLELRRR